MSDYDRIASAISYLTTRMTSQPRLEEVAAHVHLSPFHFQRLFTRWAGTTPKRFLQALTLEHGKRLLEESRPLLEVSETLGLSSSSRLHDHFVHLEAVTPGEYKSGGRDLRIRFGMHPTLFGRLFVAMTAKGVCRAAFLDDDDPVSELEALHQTWPLATFQRAPIATGRAVAAMMNQHDAKSRPLPLHVAGTNFQVAIWRALLRVPPGQVISYSQLAATAQGPEAARAAANAVAANPVALLIPCHRVIRQSGALGGYRWGQPRKRAIQAWETARLETGAGG